MPNVMINIPRRLAPIFFVIDTSGAMMGDSIAAINEGMELLIEKIKVSEEDFFYDNDVALGILSFLTDAVWRTKGLEKIKDLFWYNLCACGLSNFGEALKELNNSLSRKGLLFSVYGCRIPTIFFILEGCSTDNYIDALQALRSNRWFQESQKICVNYNFTDDQMIHELIGGEEGILTAENPVALKDIIVNEFPKYLKQILIGPKKYHDDDHCTPSTDIGVFSMDKTLADTIGKGAIDWNEDGDAWD